LATIVFGHNSILSSPYPQMFPVAVLPIRFNLNTVL